MAATALAMSGCARGDLLGPDAAQGIEGLVMIGPQCPVATVDDPCPDLPYEATVAIENGDGRVLARVTSDGEGRFHVGLRPGAYVLDPLSGAPFPTASPQEVTVVAGEYVEVLISYDTGIR